VAIRSNWGTTDRADDPRMTDRAAPFGPICDDSRNMPAPHDRVGGDVEAKVAARTAADASVEDEPSEPPSRATPPTGSAALDATAQRGEPARADDRSRSPGRPSLVFGLTAIAALAGVAGSWAILVATRAGQQLENAALRGAELRTEIERQAALDRLSQVSTTVFALAIIACFVLGQARKRGWLATVVVLAMGAAVVLAELLKAWLVRPQLVEGPAWILANSFPSGSAAVATAVGLGLYLVAPERLRWLALTIGVAVAAIINEAVQTSGWHRLSDTIGATCLAIAALFVGLWILARAGYVQRGDRGTVDVRIVRGVLLAASIVLTLGTVVLVLLALFPVLTTSVDARRALLQTAFPLIGTGWTIVVILGATRAVEPYSLGTRAVPPRDSGPGRR
jgi:hypothetical protein